VVVPWLHHACDWQREWGQDLRASTATCNTVKQLRPLAESLLWHSFRTILAIPGRMARHWRKAVATATLGLAIARVMIWIARAIATTGTVDQAAHLVGLEDYVAPFEQAFDQAVLVVLGALGIDL
jgi:hypothetical protein